MTPPSSAPVVAATELVKTFRDFWCRPRVAAVRGISFEVGPGEIFGLLGPNGSGKSTTLKMILGLLYPSAGRLRVLGASPRRVRTKNRIGYLPEESYLYPYLTPVESLNFYGRLFNLPTRERRRRSAELLEMIGLTHARDRLVGEFSKGMARRIGLAQALINDPDLVILDEPTSGLDPLGCRQMKDLVLALARRGKTVLLSSHLLADVEDVCDRIAILYNGRVVAQGPIRQLLEESRQYRITVPARNGVDWPQVRQALRDWYGGEPELDHPRRNLEQFFLEVIAKASAGKEDYSGAEPAGRLAAFLDPPPPPTP